jgi:Ner family transcriptional regulator
MMHEPTNTEVPKNPAERRAWILYRLRLRGLSFRQLARETGVSQQAMSAACMAPNIHLEPVIAEAIGLTPQALFPERWCPETGRRLTQSRGPARHRMRSLSNDTQTGDAGQRQKEHAA